MIRRRFLARGAGDGHDLEDWLQAERALQEGGIIECSKVLTNHTLATGEPAEGSLRQGSSAVVAYAVGL